MKRKILTILILIVFVAVGFSGCLNEGTVPTLAKQMEDAYNSISDYRATVNYTTYGGYAREHIKTIKKPDKLRYEYLTPEYKEGDLDIINGNTQWRYDKSKNIAYQDNCNINIGEESLATPDFLNMLLCLMNDFSVQQLDDEVVGELNTYVLEITPLTQTTFSKWKYWIDKITLFPIKWEIYDGDGGVRDATLITNFEINVGISDSEFELPEDVEILTPEDWKLPKTIEECEDIVGFSVLFPTYLPEGYALDEEYTVGSGSIHLSGDGTYQIDYFQNNVMRQGVDLVETVRIIYPHIDSYAEFIDLTSGEVLDTVNTSTGQFPSEWFGNIEVETYTNGIYLYEAIENIFESNYLPKHNATNVNINGVQSRYWIYNDTGQYSEVVYTRACLSWNLNEYWLMLTAGGDAFLDADEMVKIAESIIT